MNVDPITGATRFLLDETALKASELASEAGDGLASYRLFEHHQKGLGDLVRGVPPAQLPSPAPLRHIGIYGYRAGFVRRFPMLPPSPLEGIEALEQLRALWHGHRIAVHVSDAAPGPGVDTPEDLARVRALFA